MSRTSNKAQMIVDYVNQFIQENGYSPSVREIGAAVGLRSTASVSYHLQALQEKGLLQSPGAKGRKRAIVTSARPGQIPVIGVGGVASAENVIEMLLAGATAVEVGAANLVNPYACRDIVEALPAVMEKYKINALKEIIGGCKHG